MFEVFVGQHPVGHGCFGLEKTVESIRVFAWTQHVSTGGSSNGRVHVHPDGSVLSQHHVFTGLETLPCGHSEACF